MNITITEIVENYHVSINELNDNIVVHISESVEPIQVTIAELGAQGVPGPSAYQVAVANGFVGTEPQWLASLVPAVVNFVKNEEPTGVFNGSNNVFLAQNDFVPESVEVFLNGMHLKLLSDYNTSGNRTILLNIAPSVGETILINYIKP